MKEKFKQKKMVAGIIIAAVLIGSVVGIALLYNYINFDPQSNQRLVSDSLGRQVQLPAPQNITKIVAVQPGALRLLLYMQAEELVCGVEQIEKSMPIGRPYIYAYPELKDLPSIGPQFGGDPELIAGQEPDVIFTTYETVAGADELQALTNIPVVALDIGDDFGDLQLDEYYASLRLVGIILNKNERAEELISYINSLIEDLNDRTKNIASEDKPHVYVGGIGHQGAHGITSTDSQYEPLKFINGLNSASEIGDGHAFIDLEQLFNWQEQDKLDYVLVDAGGYDLCMRDLKNNTAGLDAAELDCIQADPPRAIMTLPYNYYTTNVGTVFVDAYYLGKCLFPDQFNDLDYANNKVYDDIYKQFLGEGVYDDLANYYGHGGLHFITHEEINSYSS